MIKMRSTSKGMKFILIFNISISILFLDNSVAFAQSANNFKKISTRFGQIGSPDITMNTKGKSVIVWQDKGSKTYEIYKQTFQENGDPLGIPERVNHFRPNDQINPKVAIDNQGNYVIIWQSYKQDGSGSGIFGRKYIADNNQKFREFRINTYKRGDQSKPVIAMNSAGNFVVAWVSSIDGSASKRRIVAQRYNSFSEPIGKEIKISQHSRYKNDNPSIAIDESGNFSIVWQSIHKKDWDIYAQVYSWDGVPISDTDILINTTTELDQTNPSIAIVNNNQFIIVWQNISNHKVLSNIQNNINAQIIDTNSTKIGNELKVTKPIFGHQSHPRLIESFSSNIYVVWQNFEQHTQKYWNISGKLIKSDGSDSSEQKIFNPLDNKWNKTPSISSDSNGNIGLVWVGLDDKKYRKNIYYESLYEDISSYN